jgi:DNA (cytosine-5)-methyltransferase 3A
MNVVVVSLFDGLSGGRLATDRVEHLNVLRYYSSEVDKYAIQVADKNYPQDTPYRLGDVTKIDFEELLKEIHEEFGNVKILLLGGSPCQGFSMAGKLKGSSTACGIDVVEYDQYMTLKSQDFEFNGQSYLFWEYIRAIKILQPDYFVLENVRVTKKWLPMFNEAMGVEPTRINSSLVSAQNRDRYYWHNFGEIPQPEDKKIVALDILQGKVDDSFYLTHKAIDYMSRLRNGKQRWEYHKNPLDGKLACLTANMYKGVPYGVLRLPTCHKIADLDMKGNESIKRVYDEHGKVPSLTTMQGGHRQPKVFDYEKESSRKLTPLECERGQTLPDGYTDVVSNSQRYKMIGNGWTIDVVAHILSYIR